MLNEIRGRFTILYGTQTGNAADVADRLGRKARRLRFGVKIFDLNDYPIHQLIQEHLVVFVCSTTGQGECPDGMVQFWKFLLRKQLPRNSLSNVSFCVVGLGDSSYEKFNVVAKRLNKRLLQLGATELLPTVLGDDQHELGYDAAIDPWIPKFFDKLSTVFPPVLGQAPLNDDILLPPYYRSSFVENTNRTDTQISDFFDPSYKQTLVKLKSNVRITSPSHFQEVRQIIFDLKETDIKYKPGDVAVLWPKNQPDKVEDFLALLDIPADSPFILHPNDSETSLPPGLPEFLTLRECATSYWDIQSIPRRSFFDLLWYFSKSELEREKLQEFTTAEGQEELYSYCNRPRRTILEVLHDFPDSTPHIPLDYLFDLIPRIRPRFFSIASSLEYHCNELHLLVAVVKYKTRLHEPRQGLCSTWLSKLDPSNNSIVPLSVKSGSISLPPDSHPLIMVGPGTGCAPFRGFIQEHVTHGIKENYFFFGCRNKAGDFFCSEEWQSFVGKGLLKLFVAFSRDQEEKVYVQHKMLEQSALLWDLISAKGAWMYIAGNSKMPQDVKSALLTIIGEQGNLDSESSKKYLCNLEAQKRLQIEAWS